MKGGGVLHFPSNALIKLRWGHIVDLTGMFSGNK